MLASGDARAPGQRRQPSLAAPHREALMRKHCKGFGEAVNLAAIAAFHQFCGALDAPQRFEEKNRFDDSGG